VRVSSTVQIDDRWPKFRDELEQGVAKSLVRAGAVGLAAGRAKPSRYNISKIQNAAATGIPTRHPFGWYIDIKWTDFRSRFFDRGTYQKLGKRLTARSKAGAAGNRGVRAQRFGNAAKRAGRLELLEALRRYL
jgi:hypothetical protein